MKDKLVGVCGDGGFIGGHLVADLREQGFQIGRSESVANVQLVDIIEDAIV